MSIRPDSRIFSFPACASVLLLLAFYRVWVLSMSSFDLYPDEAQYWFWSLTPDWGYYSKPPMVAWLITATTRLCGNTEFCVRLSAPLLHFFTALCLYGIAFSLFRERLIAWGSALTYATLPAVSLSSLIISTDVPFLFFWALALLGFVKATQSGAMHWWVMAGIAAGFGLLSKYTMIVFLSSVWLALWWNPENRKYFLSPGFYLAMTLAALIYSPNLVWNYHHGFVSYYHTKDNANLQGPLFHPLQMLEFLVSQFGVFGPLLFGTLLTCLVYLFRKPQERLAPRKVLLCFILPFLGMILTIALLSRAHANWAAPTYIASTVLVVAWLISKRYYRLFAASLILHSIVMFACYHYDDLKPVFAIPEKKATDPFRNLHGWKKLGEGVEAIHKHYPDSILLTNDRKIITSLYYYIKPLPQIVKWNADGHIQDHFELTSTMQDKQGKDFLLIVRKGQAGDIPSYFGKSLWLMTLDIQLYPDYTIPYDIYQLTDFRGY